MFTFYLTSNGLTRKYETSLKNWLRTNALAYFAAASVTKRKSLITLPLKLSSSEEVDNVTEFNTSSFSVDESDQDAEG
jgi:hypothetical protein